MVMMNAELDVKRNHAKKYLDSRISRIWFLSVPLRPVSRANQVSKWAGIPPVEVDMITTAKAPRRRQVPCIVLLPYPSPMSPGRPPLASLRREAPDSEAPFKLFPESAASPHSVTPPGLIAASTGKYTTPPFRYRADFEVPSIAALEFFAHPLTLESAAWKTGRTVAGPTQSLHRPVRSRLRPSGARRRPSAVDCFDWRSGGWPLAGCRR